MSYLPLIIAAFALMNVATVVVVALCVSRKRDPSPDEIRLDYLDVHHVSLAKTPDGDWVCMTGQPLRVRGDFAPDPRMAIDNAMGAVNG